MERMAQKINSRMERQTVNNIKTKINEIDLKYNTYSDLLMVMPQDSLRTLDELNDVEIRNNLYLRINVLLGRKK